MPPKVTSFAFGQDIQEGSQVQAFCTSSIGDQPFSFIWLKNGEKIFDSSGVSEKGRNYLSGKYELSFAQTFSTILTIPNITAEDSGNFTCLIKNLGGENSFTTSLQVIGMLSKKYPIESFAQKANVHTSEKIYSKNHIALFEFKLLFDYI